MEHEYNGMGVWPCPIYLKADVLESCARFSPLRPVVKRSGLGSVCLSRSGGVSRVCVGAVESCEKSCNIREIL